MSSQDLRNIICFAMDKEQEAADFYTDLANRVKIQAVRDELIKMAAMELGHKKKLENLNVEIFAHIERVKKPGLKIANYTVPAVPHENMSWQDVINIAIHRELASVNLYGDLAAATDDPDIKRLFENLAREEEKHKLYLETIWDQEIMKEN